MLDKKHIRVLTKKVRKGGMIIKGKEKWEYHMKSGVKLGKVN